MLKQNGLELDDFLKMEETLTGDNLDVYVTDDVTAGDWLKVILETVYSMPIIKPEYEYLSEDIKEVIEDREEFASFVRMWLTGKQYWQIAEALVLDVDDVMDLLNHFQYHFHMRIQGLIRYLGAKYEFTNAYLSLLPECVKHGVSGEIHTMLIKGGLKWKRVMELMAVNKSWSS